MLGIAALFWMLSRGEDWPEIAGPWPPGKNGGAPEVSLLTARLQAHFPQGTSHIALITSLKEQGFQIYPGNYAVWNGGYFPSDYFVRVDWTEKAGRLEAIRGTRQITSL